MIEYTEQQRKDVMAQLRANLTDMDRAEIRETLLVTQFELVTVKLEREAAQKALRACVESLELIEREMLPMIPNGGAHFAEWSHPALSMRMAREVLARS